MARPRQEYPTPGKRLRGLAWSIFWWREGRTYSVSAGAIPEREAETKRQEIGLALRTGTWPTWARASAAAVRYGRRKVAGEAIPQAGPSATLDAYAVELASETAPAWATQSLAFLRELRAVTGKHLSDVTAAEAGAFLAQIMATPGRSGKSRKGRTAATRNRALAACRRFYGWAVRSERMEHNPFVDLRPLREAEPVEIIHLSRPERDAVLEAARGLPDGLAVWLALLAGLRRGEVTRGRWDDLVEHGRLRVGVTKTGRRRVVPLPGRLIERLGELRPAGATGRIVPWPADPPAAAWRARLMVEALQAGCPAIPAERIGWNAFRHTFGSLLAQAGVSLDKISAWMGNSPAVCRRHYAEFVPRDARDEDIEALA